jgi:hypothetical protein
MESVSHFSETSAMEFTVLPTSNTHAIRILATLEKVVRSLPVLPNASESDEIAVFSENIPTDLAKEDAWEYLDLMLNYFLGFNRSEESIYNELQGGARGLEAMI